jgi:hypothetical protein
MKRQYLMTCYSQSITMIQIFNWAFRSLWRIISCACWEGDKVVHGGDYSYEPSSHHCFSQDINEGFEVWAKQTTENSMCSELPMHACFYWQRVNHICRKLFYSYYETYVSYFGLVYVGISILFTLEQFMLCLILKNYKLQLLICILSIV